MREPWSSTSRCSATPSRWPPPWPAACSWRASTPAWSRSARRPHRAGRRARPARRRCADPRLLAEPRQHPGRRRPAGRTGRARAAGLREWLESVGFDPGAPPGSSPFDTRVTKVRWLPKAAGPTRAAHVGPPPTASTPVGQPVGLPRRRHPRTARRRRARARRRLGPAARRRPRRPGRRDRRSGLRSRLTADPGTAHVTVVPAPGSERTENVPPCLSARSRMLPSPLSAPPRRAPCRRRSPGPRPRPRRTRATSTAEASRVPAGVGQRLAEHRQQVRGDVVADQRCAPAPRTAASAGTSCVAGGAVHDPARSRSARRSEASSEPEGEDGAPDVLDGAVEVVDRLLEPPGDVGIAAPRRAAPWRLSPTANSRWITRSCRSRPIRSRSSNSVQPLLVLAGPGDLDAPGRPARRSSAGSAGVDGVEPGRRARRSRPGPARPRPRCREPSGTTMAGPSRGQPRRRGRVDGARVGGQVAAP